MSFTNSLKKDYYFLNFKDERQRVIKPTYAKGGSWLPIVTLDSHLGNKSDIFYHNNENN